MEPSYGNFANLASGGAIGLALFFFCSGFTLNIIGGEPFGIIIKNEYSEYIQLFLP